MNKTAKIILGILTLGLGVVLWLLWKSLQQFEQRSIADVAPAPNDPRHPADKLFSRLVDAEVKQFFPILAQRVERLSDFETATYGEWTKYLFTANAGAAAALFALMKDKATAPLLTWGFYLFVFGVFCIGSAHFLQVIWTRELSRGASDDANDWGLDKLTIRQMDGKNRKRHQSWKVKAFFFASVLSFFALMAGGIVAAQHFSH